MRRLATITVTSLFMAVVVVPMAQAAVVVAGRVFYHTQKVVMLEAGDVPGHILGIIQQSGLTFYTKGPSSGQIATRMMNTFYDVLKTKGGSYTAYIVDTFQDGSTVIYKAIGTITPVGEGDNTTIEGTYEITGGTGRFEGKKGKGSFKGGRIGSLKTGGDSYADFAGTEWR
jgi:hypothetical protein